jgi:hypothetical protein
MRQGPKMLVHQLTRLTDPLLEAAREDFPWRHFIGECCAGPPQQCLDLLGWQRLREHIDQVGQHRDVGFRKKLLYLRCQVE